MAPAGFGHGSRCLRNGESRITRLLVVQVLQADRGKRLVVVIRITGGGIVKANLVADVAIRAGIVLSRDDHRLAEVPVGVAEAQVVRSNSSLGGVVTAQGKRHRTFGLAAEAHGELGGAPRFRGVVADRADHKPGGFVVGVDDGKLTWCDGIVVRLRRPLLHQTACI